MATLSSIRSPGVYIQELPAGSRPIEGVGTAIAAFVGITADGPYTIKVRATDLAGNVQTELTSVSVTVSVSWETENATAVDLAVDTAAPLGFGPSGSTDVTVPCDDAPHAITITPRSDAGPGVPETEQVESG